MKFFFTLLLLIMQNSCIADTTYDYSPVSEQVQKQRNPIKTGKLSITGYETDIWLKFYEAELDRGRENIIPLTANFNLNKVRSIMITDENASKNLCGKKQQRTLLLLSFGQPEKNVKQVQTYINRPCFDGHKARFKLTVETTDGSYYTNTTTLTAVKNAFSSIYDANYDVKRNPYKIKNTGSSRLNIISLSDGDTPNPWVITEKYSYPGKVTTTPIAIRFDVKNAKTIKIDDINAHNNKCTVNNPINLLNLSFMDPKVAQTKITTEIPTPCLYHDKAKLQLSVKTENGDKYFKVITLPRKAVEY